MEGSPSISNLIDVRSVWVLDEVFSGRKALISFELAGIHSFYLSLVEGSMGRVLKKPTKAVLPALTSHSSRSKACLSHPLQNFTALSFTLAAAFVLQDLQPFTNVAPIF